MRLIDPWLKQQRPYHAVAADLNTARTATAAAAAATTTAAAALASITVAAAAAAEVTAAAAAAAAAAPAAAPAAAAAAPAPASITLTQNFPLVLLWATIRFYSLGSIQETQIDTLTFGGTHTLRLPLSPMHAHLFGRSEGGGDTVNFANLGRWTGGEGGGTLKHSALV